MSPIGRWSAIAAAILGLFTISTWHVGDPSPAVAADLDGARLFRAKGCAGCHVGPDSAASSASGFPSLAHATEWAGDRRPGLTATDYLTESIVAPDAFVSPEFRPSQGGPTTAMPHLILTAEEVDALVDHLLGSG